MPCRRLAIAILVLAAVAPAAAGCGSGSASGEADPAATVPRDALLYVEAVVRPEREARDRALDAAGKVFRTHDPQRRLRELVEQALADGGARVDFERDVGPWLGDRAGLWVGPTRGREPSGSAAAIAVTDEDAARSSLASLMRRSGHRLSAARAGDTDYETTSDGKALAVRDGYALIGDDAEVRRALTLGDGRRLADADAYRQAVAELARDRIGTLYVDTRRLLRAAAAQAGAAGSTSPIEMLLAGGAVRPQAASLTADGERITVESVAEQDRDALQQLGPLGGAAATPLLEELPGDSWVALGVPRSGAALRAALSRAAGALGATAAVERQLRRELGLDLERDLLSWMGDLAVFARGDRPASLDGGVVVQVTDEERAASGFGKLVGLARVRGGLPTQPIRVPGADAAFDLGFSDGAQPAVLARGNGRVVLAYGVRAAAAGLSAAHTLGDADAYARARDALGDDLDPAGLVSLPAIVALVDGSGTADADWQRAKPYLEAFDVLTWGAERDGDKIRLRYVAGMR